MLTTLIEPLAMALDAFTLHKARRVSKHWRNACGCAWAALKGLIAELRHHKLAWRTIDPEPWAANNNIIMHNRTLFVVTIRDAFDGYEVKESGEIVPFPPHLWRNGRENILVHFLRCSTSLYKRLRLWLAYYNTETYVLNMLLNGKFSFVTTNSFARPARVARQLTFPDSHDLRFVYFVAVPDARDQPLHVCHIDVGRGVGVWTSLPDSMVLYGYLLVRCNQITLYRDPPRTIEF